MRHFIKHLSAIFAFSVMLTAFPSASPAQTAVSVQVFYDELSPYGTWHSNPNYGYVWTPALGADFFPYASNGYWAWTDYGWTWVSNYSWGWAPFHYGRWDYDAAYGWFWVPDTYWAPAWVVWSESPSYCGWAPMRPGISVEFAFSSGYVPPYDHWVYCNEGYLGRHDLYRHYEPRTEYGRIGGESRVINRSSVVQNTHIAYASGPTKERVQAASGAPVKQLIVADRKASGEAVNNGQVQMYRPTLQRSTAATSQPIPKTLAPARAATAPLQSKPQAIAPKQQSSQQPVQQRTQQAMPSKQAPIQAMPQQAPARVTPQQQTFRRAAPMQQHPQAMPSPPMHPQPAPAQAPQRGNSSVKRK
jgi:hypothetical protein